MKLCFRTHVVWTGPLWVKLSFGWYKVESDSKEIHCVSGHLSENQNALWLLLSCQCWFCKVPQISLALHFIWQHVHFPSLCWYWSFPVPPRAAHMEAAVMPQVIYFMDGYNSSSSITSWPWELDKIISSRQLLAGSRDRSLNMTFLLTLSNVFFVTRLRN